MVRFHSGPPKNIIWGLSSAGRAPALHAGGQRFDPARLHHNLYYYFLINGGLAQLGEHLPYKQGVTGSSPVFSTIYAGIAQRGRATDL